MTAPQPRPQTQAGTHPFQPKLLSTLRGYDRGQLARDVSAGVVVGIVALPLAIAFAIASGVTPERGLATAIVAGLLISALGGSRVQIGGPTGAFVVIVYGIVEKFGYDGLAVATMMAGVMLLLLGVARLGGAIKFIPHPVVQGFTTGIAVIIGVGQLRDLLGLRMTAVPADFLEKLRAYAEHLGTVNPHAVGVAALSLLVITQGGRVSRRVPSPFLALVVGTAAVQLLDLPVETVGSRFGEFGAALPRPSLPAVDFGELQQLAGPAFTIALLGAVESLLSAVVADGMIGTRHRSNTELVAQGIANIASPIFGGIPATGALARTATNVKSGGRTPVAGIVHAITLLLIALFFGRWASLIPMATLGAVLAVVAYNMSEWRNFVAELRAPRSDVAVLLVTFALTVLVDLTVAIEVGMVLAAFLFMRRMAEVTNVQAVTREFADAQEAEDADAVRLRAVPKGVEVYEIDGPFFFGAAERFKDTLGQIAAKPKVLIIRMRKVPAMDSTGMHALKELAHRSRREGTLVVLSDVHSQPMIALGRSALLDELGDENIVGSIDEALARAREYLRGSGDSVN
jgi:sulfate permease, SulP family